MKLNQSLHLAALVAAGLLSAGLTLQAQDATPATPAPATATATPDAAPPARPRRLTPDQIAQKLGLADDVATKFKAALQDQMSKLRDLRNDSSLSTDDKKAKRKEITDATLATLKDILTADQLEQYKN